MTEQEYKIAFPSLKTTYQQWLGNEIYNTDNIVDTLSCYMDSPEVKEWNTRNWKQQWEVIKDAKQYIELRNKFILEHNKNPNEYPYTVVKFNQEMDNIFPKVWCSSDLIYNEQIHHWFNEGCPIGLSDDYSYIVACSTLRLYKDWCLTSIYGNMELQIISTQAGKHGYIELNKDTKLNRDEKEVVENCCKSKKDDSTAMRHVREILRRFYDE